MAKKKRGATKKEPSKLSGCLWLLLAIGFMAFGGYGALFPNQRTTPTRTFTRPASVQVTQVSTNVVQVNTGAPLSTSVFRAQDLDATETVAARNLSGTQTAEVPPTWTPLPPTETLTATRQPSRTPLPTRTVVAQTMYTTTRANLRSCASTTCASIATVAANTAFAISGTEAGAVVAGSDRWYISQYNNRTVYIHSSVLSRNRVTVNTGEGSSQGSSGSSSGSGNAPAAPPPQQPAAPPPPPAPNYSCNCSKTCEQMSSCAEAYFQLNQCGCGRRDGDGDGVPCENICPGG